MRAYSSRENKYQRYTRRCVESGHCPACGKPSAPYYYCADHRKKNSQRRAKNRNHHPPRSPEALVYRPRDSSHAPLPLHCLEGHEMTPENTYVVPGKPRTFRCKQCDRQRLSDNAAAPDRGAADAPLPCRSEEHAILFLEAVRWPEGARCPRCDGWNVHAMMKSGETRIRSDHYRWKCNECRRQFSVRIGTPFEASRLPLHVWLHALYRRKEGSYSAFQLQRETGVSYKSCLRVMDTVTLILSEEPGKSVYESSQRHRMRTERMARTRQALDASERYAGPGRHAEVARQEREKREWQKAAQLLRTLREAVRTCDLEALRSPSGASAPAPISPS